MNVQIPVADVDNHGHGEVFSERRQPRLEAYLGNHYPASDIPQMARRLYERNRVRVLVDVGYKPVPLKPVMSPITGKNLDMSMCFLRSMSPIHIQYLQNMGVAATLVVSLMVGGKLWGLIACHHYVSRFVHFEVRAVCELLAEAIGTRIAALESFTQAQAELSVRRIEQRLVESIAREGDWKLVLFDGSLHLLLPSPYFLRNMRDDYAVLPSWAPACAWLGLLAGAALLLRYARRAYTLVWSLAFALVALAPTAMISTSLWPGFGRYLYVPALGFGVALGCALAAWRENARFARRTTSRIRRFACAWFRDVTRCSKIGGGVR